jgi:hypothetical protein
MDKLRQRWPQVEWAKERLQDIPVWVGRANGKEVRFATEPTYRALGYLREDIDTILGLKTSQNGGE